MAGYITELLQINNGLAANDGTGTTLRTGADIINANFNTTRTVVNLQAAIDTVEQVGNGVVVHVGSGAGQLGGAQTTNGNSVAMAAALNYLAVSLSAGSQISFLTKSAMDADLAHGDGTIALVTNDPTSASNMAYRKTGASGAGAWMATIDRMALALGNGAGFQQAGTGLPVRTFQDKNRERKTIADFILPGDVGIGAALVRAKAANVRRLILPAGTYYLSGSTGCDVSNMIIEGEGSDSTIIDCTGCTATYPIYSQGALAPLPNLGDNVVKGSWVIPFASSPGLAEGDVFIIYNAEDSSWSGHRTYYHAGEFCEVLAVSGNNVTIRGALYDSYAAASVSVYKLNSATLEMRNLRVVGGVGSTGLVQASLSKDALFEKVKILAANDSGLSLDRCYRPVVRDVVTRNTGTGASANPYGLVFLNSQHGRVFGGDYFSKWTGIDMGGTAVVGSVPCRDIVIEGAVIRNDPTTQDIHAAGMHGNAEGCGYVNSTIYGGLGLAGADAFTRGCRIYSQRRGLVIDINEILGGVFEIGAGTQLVSTADPFPNAKGFIDVGGSSSEVSSSTTRELTVKVGGVTLRGSAVTSGITSFVKVTNNGATVPINIDIQNVSFDLPSAINILVLTLASGTAASNYIIIDRIAKAPAGTRFGSFGSNEYLNFPMRLQKQSGVYSGVTTSGVRVIADPIALRLVYPRSPICKVAICGVGTAVASTVGGKVGVGQAYQSNLASVRPMVQSSDGGAFAAGDNFEMRWETSIDEC